jgi:anhydro-N-acetylmuramic acid kinase
MINKQQYVLGVMSGTSCDGLDVALLGFSKGSDYWHFKILEAHTYNYDELWRKRLLEAFRLDGLNLMRLHNDFGKFIAEKVNHLLCKVSEDIRANIIGIASHGHTVYHQPFNGFSTQIGSGAHIAIATGIPCICDFRSSDVALGGQGAPLVPFADALLFNDYDACLNMGGFANISFHHNGSRVAYDICPLNIVLNELMRGIGKSFDQDGTLAASGKLIPELFALLNNHEYYHQPAPKSLGREMVDCDVIPVLKQALLMHHLADVVHTFSQHAAYQIALALNQCGKMVLATGGGVYNSFVTEKIKAHYQGAFVIPDNMLINFKEALAFGFLGLMRLKNEVNVFHSVTGAKRNHSAGAVYLP